VRIATYNVNGINGRLAVLLRWLEETAPDVVCLQELKTTDETVPDAAIRGAGYHALRKPDGSMQFEKESSRNSQLAYSSLAGTHGGEQVNVRVRAEVVDLGAGSHRLQCKAWMVRDAGDSFFEEEVALTNFRRGPYQKLLEEVASRLK